MGVGTLSAIGPCVAQVCVVRRRRCHDYGQPTPIWINQSWKEGRTKKREPGGGRALCGRPTHPPDNSSQPGGESGKSQGGGRKKKGPVLSSTRRRGYCFFFCLKLLFSPGLLVCLARCYARDSEANSESVLFLASSCSGVRSFSS